MLSKNPPGRPRKHPKAKETTSDLDKEAHEQELRRKCFDLRIQGESYWNISQALGLPNGGTAFNYVKARIQELKVYEKETLDEIWLADYHGLLKVKLKLQQEVASGGRNLAANAGALVRVMQRIASMLGYDQPIQVRNVHEGNVNVHATASLAIDYSRLTVDELRVIERIFEKLGVGGTGEDQGREIPPQLSGVREAGMADTEPIN